MSNSILLYGCAPEPLIHYLKALGVLRLVAEQFDPQVRGAWSGDTFVLKSSRSKDEIRDFFFEHYCPTPIVSPWNNGSGFHSDDGSGIKAVTLPRMKRTTSRRLESYRNVIQQAEELLIHCLTPEIVALNPEKRSEALKPILVPLCRNNFPDAVVSWLDAVCIVTDSNKALLPPLLGSAGNDGNLEFSLNYMDRILSVLPDAIQQERAQLQESQKISESSEDTELDQTKIARKKKQAERQISEQCEISRKQLEAALFANQAAPLMNASVGQFHPAGAGGANASQGVNGNSFVNPWDFILAIEGTLLLANASVRRLAQGARTSASFPFTTRGSSVGYGTAIREEDVRSEVWLPLWTRFVSLPELVHIFGEGRVRFNHSTKKIAQTGFDFARAVAELGVDRGIEAFSRFAFAKRLGKNFLAIPLGRFEVRERPRASLIHQVDSWLDTLSRAAFSDKQPRFIRVAQRIEDASFRLCETGSADHLREVLLSLGAAEAELANGETFRNKNKLRPLSGVRLQWASECNDNSAEFKLAVAIASICGPKSQDFIRENLEPVTVTDKSIDWSVRSTCAVWGKGSLAENLAAVLHRRSIDARTNSRSHPVLTGRRFASLITINTFLNDETDDPRVEELLRGLILLDWHRVEPDAKLHTSPRAVPATLPRVYALLKLLFLPDGKLQRKENSEPILIKHEPAIVPLLRAGRVAEAVQIATQRLRASGLIPAASEFYFDDAAGVRLAASLLIPIDQPSIRALAALVLREPTEDQ